MKDSPKKILIIFSGFLVLINVFSLFFSKFSDIPLKSIQISFHKIRLGELEILPGLGRERAYRIYSYRVEKGSCQNYEDLLEVYGIGENVLRKIEKFLSFPNQKKD